MSDMALLLIGAGIALLSSVVTALIQHALSLRVDRVNTERDRLYEEQKHRREELLKGSGTLRDIVETLDNRTELGLLISEDRQSIPHRDSSQPLVRLSAEELEGRVTEEQLRVEILSEKVSQQAQELAILRAALEGLTPTRDRGKET